MAAAPETIQDKIAKLKAADAGKVKKHKVDRLFSGSAASQVHEDYNAVLHQTDIGRNNNKFYIIQVIKTEESFFAFKRWGRDGEDGRYDKKPFSDADAAIKDFEKKFQEKTRNKWADRDNFSPVKGKYTLLAMAGDEDDGEDQITDGEEKKTLPSKLDEPTQDVVKLISCKDTDSRFQSALKITDGEEKRILPCKMDKPTHDLVKLIFDNDMFQSALEKFELDTKKMPLGKLSNTQIARGFEVLEELEEAINKESAKSKIDDITSRFYTVIPHSFGRRVPPAINTLDAIQEKYDMLAVLGDIGLAQSLQKENAKRKAEAKAEATELEPHPFDVNYDMLNCDLKLLDKSDVEFKTLEKYFQATKGANRLTLKQIWSMKREGEYERFSANKKLDHRKLLWHGTDVAAVTAILKTGLPIMPHSGGRVGRGIYFASENNKSAGYVRPAKGYGIMFLNEVALGKQKCIIRDDCSLTKAPQGFDSVLACGQQEPDSQYDITLNMDGYEVIVPQGQPKKRSEYSNSSFVQSEYVVYREDQVCMRYMLLFEM